MTKTLQLVALGLMTLVAGHSVAPADDVVLDATCTVNILNRTVQVDAEGGWSMPNVPSTMGKVRARVTCIREGQTISGQTDFFTVNRNGVTETGPFLFGDPDPPPRRLDVIPAGRIDLNALGATTRLSVTATYPDDSTRDVSAGDSGTNYMSSNPAIVGVDDDGLLTAVASGNVLLTIRQDGVIAVIPVRVNLSGGIDSDGDGLDDEYEIANGLNPNDPVDALEDHDGDGLSALAEFANSTDIHNPDTDGDLLNDGDEVSADNGYVTNPLVIDSDGDRLPDNLEILAGTDPTDADSANYGFDLTQLSIEPNPLVIVYNTLYGEASRPVRVIGSYGTGQEIDLTDEVNYASSDLAIASFGAAPGEIFATPLEEGEVVDSGDYTAVVTASFRDAATEAVIASTDVVVTTRLQAPERVGFINFTDGYANNVDVAGDLAFVAAGSAGLKVVDIADRSDPVLVAELDTPGNANDIKMAGDNVLIADGNRGLRVIDVSDLSNLREIGAYDPPGGSAWDLVVHDTRIFLANGGGGLEIIDIARPEAPFKIAQINTANTAKGVAVSADGSLAVVAIGAGGIQTFDVSDPSNPRSLNTLDTGEGGDVTLQGDYAYVAGRNGGFTVVDVSDPSNPVQGVTIHPDFGGRVADIAVQERLAFNADYFWENGVPIIGIEDPDNAQQRNAVLFRFDGVGYRDDNGTGIAIDASHVYLTAAYRDISENGSSGTTRAISPATTASANEPHSAPGRPRRRPLPATTSRSPASSSPPASTAPRSSPSASTASPPTASPTASPSTSRNCTSGQRPST
jgi:hypothetical protein